MSGSRKQTNSAAAPTTAGEAVFEAKRPKNRTKELKEREGSQMVGRQIQLQLEAIRQWTVLRMQQWRRKGN